jgi:hypothetical protein
MVSSSKAETFSLLGVPDGQVPVNPSLLFLNRCGTFDRVAVDNQLVTTVFVNP